MPNWLSILIGIVGTFGTVISVISLMFFVSDKRKKGKMFDLIKYSAGIYKDDNLEELPVDSIRGKHLNDLFLQRTVVKLFKEKFSNRILRIGNDFFVPMVKFSIKSDQMVINNSFKRDLLDPSKSTKGVYISILFFSVKSTDENYILRSDKHIDAIEIKWDLYKNKIIAGPLMKWNPMNLLSYPSPQLYKINGVPKNELIRILNIPEFDIKNEQLVLHPKQEKLIRRLYKKIVIGSVHQNVKFERIEKIELIPYLFFEKQRIFQGSIRCSFSSHVLIDNSIKDKEFYIKKPKFWKLFTKLKIYLTKKSAKKFNIDLKIM